MRTLNYKILLKLPVAINATTPVPSESGVIIWSTSVNMVLQWDGTVWTPLLDYEIVYPQGTLVCNGASRVFYAIGSTASDGTCTLNLTTDNTATGPAIFSSLRYVQSQATGAVGVTTPENAVISFPVSETVKVIRHGYFKSNVVTLSIGLLLKPVIMVGSSVAVRFKIEGK